MIDPKVLKVYGTTDERLREIFLSPKVALPSDIKCKEYECIMRDRSNAASLVDLLTSRATAGASQSLRGASMIQAADIAWDGDGIQRQIVPLLLYAQKRIGQQALVKALKDANCADKYISKDEDGKPVVNINQVTASAVKLVHSIITRRTAAQSTRYCNLWPLLKYQSRSETEPSKLVADLVTQRIEIMSDQFGYRGQHDDWNRSMLLYPFCLVVPKSKWQCDYSIASKVDPADPGIIATPSVDDNGSISGIETVVTREGVPLTCPHPSRVFWDNSAPLRDLNADIGPEFFGHWDIIPVRTFSGACYFNTDIIPKPNPVGGNSWSAREGQYPVYFGQYYGTNGAGLFTHPDFNDLHGPNYTATSDAPVWVSHLYCKLRPSDYGIGSYPVPVWIHFTMVNEAVVVSAEIMPSTPAAVFQYNASSHRQQNPSMASEIFAFQDQLTSLTSNLMNLIQMDVTNIILMNRDAFPSAEPESVAALKKFRDAVMSGDWRGATLVLEYSGINMKNLGVDMRSENIISRLHVPTTDSITKILQGIPVVISTAERMLSMSANEGAQLSQRETSATEATVVANTTAVIVEHVGDAIDEGRSALRRMLYEHYLAYGEEKFELPVSQHYSEDAIQKAGLRVEESNNGRPAVVSGLKHVLGSSDVKFTSKDGPDRGSGPQAMQTMVSLMGLLGQPALGSLITKDQGATLLNTIIRMSGTGINVVIPTGGPNGNAPFFSEAPAQDPRVLGNIAETPQLTQ